MKALTAAILVTLSVMSLGSVSAKAGSDFGTRSWFSERLNGG